MGDVADGEVACTSTGYHMLTRRKVALTFAAGRLSLREDGHTRVLGRAECRPLMWSGSGRNRPLHPLPALALTSDRGEWIVGTIDASVGLAEASEHESPAPHVWVSGADLANMAGACGFTVHRAAVPVVATVMPSRKAMLAIFGGVTALSLLSTVIILNRTPGPPPDCSQQKPPRERLYPRLTCEEARAELARVQRGEAEPRAVVLRPTALTIDARDITGPGKLICDGVELAVIDAAQADPGGPIVYYPGPHSVLATELPGGQLRVSQYVICGDVVGRERRG